MRSRTLLSTAFKSGRSGEIHDLKRSELVHGDRHVLSQGTFGVGAILMSFIKMRMPVLDDIPLVVELCKLMSDAANALAYGLSEAQLHVVARSPAKDGWRGVCDSNPGRYLLEPVNACHGGTL